MTPDGLFRLLSSASCGAFALATDQTVVFWNRRAREILGYTPARVVGQRCSGIACGLGEATLTGDCAEGCRMVRSLRAGLVPSRAKMRMRSAWGEWKWLEVTPMVVSGMEDGDPLLIYLFDDPGEAALSADVKRLVELGNRVEQRQNEIYYTRPSDFPTDPTGSSPVEPDAPKRRRANYAEPNQTAETELREEDAGYDGNPPASQSPEPPRPTGIHLTEREREVLSYLALGWKTKYIAEELGVSPYTARNHIENLRTKLGASSRLEAVMVARRLGLIPS